MFSKSKVNIPKSKKCEENDTPFPPTNKNTAPTLLLKGSYHQRSEMFSGETQGRQCVAMATSAAAFTVLKKANLLSSANIDIIMNYDGKHYKSVSNGLPPEEHGLLLISDIPKQSFFRRIL